MLVGLTGAGSSVVASSSLPHDSQRSPDTRKVLVSASNSNNSKNAVTRPTMVAAITRHGIFASEELWRNEADLLADDDLLSLLGEHRDELNL